MVEVLMTLMFKKMRSIYLMKGGLILDRMKETVQSYIGKPVLKAIVTVPSYSMINKDKLPGMLVKYLTQKSSQSSMNLLLLL